MTLTPTASRSSADPTAQTTVLSFSDEDDHCHYDPSQILGHMSADDRATLTTTFTRADIDTWTTSIDLYCAVETLEEAGHDALAEYLGGCIHAEQIYGCLCRNEALAAFKDQVGALLVTIESDSPHGTWWTPHRVYAQGLDADFLLSDAGFRDADSDGVTVELDSLGNGTVTTETTIMPIVGFTTPELGTFLQHLDADEIPVSHRPGDYLPAVDVWTSLHAQAREVMASVWVHDAVVGTALLGDKAPLGAGRVRGRHLSLEQLELAAGAVTALPAPLPEAILSLLSSSASPEAGRRGLGPVLDDLITAMQASCLPS